MTAARMTMRRGLVLPATLAVLLLCGMMIFAAYRMVEMGGQAVARQIDQTTCRVAAMTALELYATELQNALNDYCALPAVRGQAWCATYQPQLIDSAVKDFNARLSALKAGGYAEVDEHLRLALCGDRGGEMTVSVEAPSSVAAADTTGSRDNCFAHYLEATLRATAQLKRGGKATGARSTMEQRVRLGALGYDDAGNGKYDKNIFALPGRAYEFALHAESPLRFNTRRGDSYWFINGDLAAKGHIYFGGSGGDDSYYALNGSYPYVSVQGEMHASPDADAVGKYAGAAWNGRVVGRPSRMALEGAGPGVRVKSVTEHCKIPCPGKYNLCRSRPESPTVASVKSGMVSWCREMPWLKFDFSSSAVPGTTFVNSLGYGYWDGGYQWRRSTEENVFEGAAAFWTCQPSVNSPYIATGVNAVSPRGTLNTVAQTRGGRTFQAASYAGHDGASGNVYVFGTPDTGGEFKIDGPVYFDGDVFIGGAFSGRGAIYSGGNIYVCESVYAAKANGTTANSGAPSAPQSYAPNFITDRNSRYCADMQNRAQLALVARGNIVIGDWSRSDFEEKVCSVMPQFAGYGLFHSPRTAEGHGDPFAVGGLLTGNYADHYLPKTGSETYNKKTWQVSSVCEKPVLLIEAVLSSGHGVFGLMGPRNFAGYAYSNADGRNPMNGIIAAWTMTPFDDRTYAVTYLPDYCIGEIDGAVVCRDFGICADLDDTAVHPISQVNWGQAVGEKRPFLLLNHDCRLKASGDAALLDTRMATQRRNSQNPCYLPGDYSSMPQILWWREVHDGTQNVQPDFAAIDK